MYNLYVPASRETFARSYTEDDVIAAVASRNIHVLARVVTTDHWRSRVSWCGDSKAVIDAITNKRTILSGASNGRARTATCERRRNVKLGKVKSK